MNRDVLHDIGYRTAALTNRTANWSVGSFFLNRVAGLVLWSGRSLYGNATYDDDELVSLRGFVEFGDYDASRRQQRTEESRAQVDDIVQALLERRTRQVSMQRREEEASSGQGPAEVDTDEGGVGLQP